MDSYGLAATGCVAVEGGRVGGVPMQKYSWRLHAMAFIFMVGMWSKNGPMGRPICKMKAKKEIFQLVVSTHTYSCVVLKYFIYNEQK